MASSERTTLVDAATLGRLFNATRLYERVMDGEAQEEVRSDYHLSRRQARRAGQRYCTHSRAVIYRDRRGGALAVVHQYLHRDRLAGSGRPDPKWLRHEGAGLCPRREMNRADQTVRRTETVFGTVGRGFESVLGHRIRPRSLGFARQRCSPLPSG